MQDVVVPDPARRAALTAFFFWTTWASATKRPGHGGHLHQQLAARAAHRQPRRRRQHPVVDRQRRAAARRRRRASCGGARSAASDEPRVAAAGHATRSRASRSRRRCARSAKYLAVVVALFVVQVLLGALTAHYTVEGQAFFGFPLAEYLPYSLTRTWHIQTAMFWIATAFLAAGLFLAPVDRRPRAALPAPRRQRAVRRAARGRRRIAGGRMDFAIHQQLPLGAVVLARAPGLRVRGPRPRLADRRSSSGLVLWLALMLRGLWPALGRRDGSRSLVLDVHRRLRPPSA